MADIAATDVTYTEKAGTAQTNAASRREAVFSVAFGDGALTYPTGGVPLTKAKLGCPNVIESLVFADEANANGFVYKYDDANAKIRIYQSAALDGDAAAAAALAELEGGVATPAAATLKVKVSGW